MPHSTKAKRTFSAQKLRKTPMFSLHGSNAQFENCANAANRSKRFQERRHCEPRIRPNSSILLPDVFVFGGDTLLLPGIVAIFFHTIPPDYLSVCARVILFPIKTLRHLLPMHFLHSSIDDLTIVQMQHFTT
jgi:hypothetical protein